MPRKLFCIQRSAILVSRDTETFDAVKKAQLKFCLASKLASMAKTGILPAVRALSMTKSVLLLLSNSAFAKNADEMNTQKRLDALLSGYGLQRVIMPKDGNCLFSSIAFSLQNMLNLQRNVIDSSLVVHLESIGMTCDVSMERGMIPGNFKKANG